MNLILRNAVGAVGVISAVMSVGLGASDDLIGDSDCPATPTVSAKPPSDPRASALGKGPWFVNGDRTIWANYGEGWVAGAKANKVLWIRPSGTDLKISGTRVDNAEAAPLEAEIACCYPSSFQATALTFPSSGCWQVIAIAGDSEMSFISYVKEEPDKG